MGHQKTFPEDFTIVILLSFVRGMTTYLIFLFTAVASLPLGWRLVTKISFSFLFRIINSLDPSLYCVLTSNAAFP